MDRTRVLSAGLAAGVLTTLAGTAQGDEVLLQWFENNWNAIELRMPDYFMAGYSGTWLPPVMQPNDQSSPGFDQFDKFDAGTPNDPTIYGTERDLLSVIDMFHRAGANVYVDTILNHASGRSTSNFFLYDQGGYPGFWSGPRGFGEFKSATENWGDFHGGNGAGFQQSENPGGSNYNLFDGDLVALIDIDQFSNNLFVRHPVDAANPQNIPGGSVFNRVDEHNARFYPDLDLAPDVFVNPANGQTFTVHPFNEADPMQGDPVAENAAGLLMRHSQWMLEYFKVDGFRLDAVKHVPQAFWNDSWDAAVFNRWQKPDGTAGTPFSFGEAVADNGFISTFTRKDGFGNRDALDLNGAGRLREMVFARGFGSWQPTLNQHLDNQDDGFNNGTLGVNHLYSHDNGSAGDGGSAPAIPAADRAGWHALAYLLMRPGPSIVYHNAREMHDRFAFRGFWPREGNPAALGLDRDRATLNDTVTTLVGISNEYARGDYIPLSSGVADVLVFERRQPGGGRSNVIVGVNDRYDSGFDSRTFFTNFPQGTVLEELTGNAVDPQVDPNNDIFDTVTVGGSGQVTIRVPRNASAAGEHNKGFVIYGPAKPIANLQVAPVSMTLPVTPAVVPSWNRSLVPVGVVKGDSMIVQVVTAPNPNAGADTDDNAIFRFARGFIDLNGNGSVDITGGEFAGWEQFVDVNQPLFGTSNSNGVYQQAVDTSLLPEGYNYINAAVFRHRTAGDAIYSDQRMVVYIDRVDPDLEIDASGIDCVSGTGTVVIENPDRTATEVFVFVDLPEGAPVPTPTAADRAFNNDRGLFLFPVSGLSGSVHSFTVVARESPRGVLVRESVTRVVQTIAGLTGDVNSDGVADIEDLYDFEALTGIEYVCEADLDNDGDNDGQDQALLADLLRAGELADVDGR